MTPDANDRGLARLVQCIHSDPSDSDSCPTCILARALVEWADATTALAKAINDGDSIAYIGSPEWERLMRAEQRAAWLCEEVTHD